MLLTHGLDFLITYIISPPIVSNTARFPLHDKKWQPFRLQGNVLCPVGKCAGQGSISYSTGNSALSCTFPYKTKYISCTQGTFPCMQTCRNLTLVPVDNVFTIFRFFMAESRYSYFELRNKSLSHSWLLLSFLRWCIWIWPDFLMWLTLQSSVLFSRQCVSEKLLCF